MRVMAQMAMVMNLDKCIGCHTCSVTCKQAWTNRQGMEYVWFNNVETRPGLGYPRGYEDQEEWRGGWVRADNGRLKLRAGGRLNKLLNIFSNPKMPSIQDYYEPWTYDYETLLNAPAQDTFPVARPRSLITGKQINIEWSANWDDDLGGSTEHAVKDPMLKGIEDKVKFEFEQTFMFYLPRICEHCLNPSCAASCPSGAIYKREEDGIVLVDQDKCRGWRMCVTGCPYKKVYFNHKTGKAEKCTFCYPRVEVGIPTVCAETCVGRLRYIGLMLYDADRVLEAAAVEDEHDLYEAQRSVFLDPRDPAVQREAERAGIPGDWIEAAKRSPVLKLINDYKVALPLHPEYRTMPMVWYIPPLSPVVDVIKDTGHDAEDKDNLFAAIDALRIPVEYLANLFTAGDTRPVEAVLRRLAAMRSYMRDINLGRDPQAHIAEAVGMSEEDMYEMFRLLAIAKYGDRYVIPTAHGEQAHALEELATDCPVSSFDDELLDASGPFGEGSGPGSVTPVAVENMRMLQERAGADTLVSGATKRGRVNLLNWDGRGMPEGLFPQREEGFVGETTGTPVEPTSERALLENGEARPDNVAGADGGPQR
jgi:nitrate reductase / nitrite oxidoreductase, beta subunit